MTHFDKIAALTHQTFNTLIATIPENLAGRKVIAGMVMKRGEDDVGIVISIGTGEQILSSIFFFLLCCMIEKYSTYSVIVMPALNYNVASISTVLCCVIFPSDHCFILER